MSKQSGPEGNLCFRLTVCIIWVDQLFVQMFLPKLFEKVWMSSWANQTSTGAVYTQLISVTVYIKKWVSNKETKSTIMTVSK